MRKTKSILLTFVMIAITGMYAFAAPGDSLENCLGNNINDKESCEAAGGCWNIEWRNEEEGLYKGLFWDPGNNVCRINYG